MILEYEKLPINCDCAFASIEEAARRIGPAFVYTLTVAPAALLYTRTMLKRLAADTQGNPLAPYINLATDSALGIYEWVLSANLKACGSPGC